MPFSIDQKKENSFAIISSWMVNRVKGHWDPSWLFLGWPSKPSQRSVQNPDHLPEDRPDGLGFICLLPGLSLA